MGQVKAPEIPRPNAGLTEFERKLTDLLFKVTRTEELSVERLFDVATQIAPEILKTLPKWKRGTPPHKGWWLTRTECGDGKIQIACESWVDDKWPHEYEDNVRYMDFNELKDLPNEE